MIRGMHTLMVLPVHNTTPRLWRAEWSFSTVSHPSSEERSKTSVKTRLRMIALKVARSVALLCSSSAWLGLGLGLGLGFGFGLGLGFG